MVDDGGWWHPRPITNQDLRISIPTTPLGRPHVSVTQVAQEGEGLSFPPFLLEPWIRGPSSGVANPPSLFNPPPPGGPQFSLTPVGFEKERDGRSVATRPPLLFGPSPGSCPRDRREKERQAQAETHAKHREEMRNVKAPPHRRSPINIFAAFLQNFE